MANTEREGAGEAERPANRVWKAMVFAYLGLAALFLAGSVGAALIALDKPASRDVSPGTAEPVDESHLSASSNAQDRTHIKVVAYAPAKAG